MQKMRKPRKRCFPIQEAVTYLKLGFEATAAVGTRRSAKALYMSSMQLERTEKKSN